MYAFGAVDLIINLEYNQQPKHYGPLYGKSSLFNYTKYIFNLDFNYHESIRFIILSLKGD